MSNQISLTTRLSIASNVSPRTILRLADEILEAKGFQVIRQNIRDKPMVLSNYKGKLIANRCLTGHHKICRNRSGQCECHCHETTKCNKQDR